MFVVWIKDNMAVFDQYKFFFFTNVCLILFLFYQLITKIWKPLQFIPYLLRICKVKDDLKSLLV